MFVYTDTRSTAALSSTSASADTEVDHYRLVAAATRPAAIQAVYVSGRGAGLTSITGLGFRVRGYGTGSTGGTATAKVPKDPGAQAAPYTSFSDATTITPGSTPTNHVIFGCGAAGPGGWVAPNPDSTIVAVGTTGSLDLLSTQHGSSAMSFEWSVEVLA